MKNKILEKYNNSNSLLVISGYPKKGEIYSKGVCAVSSFTKNTLLNLQKINPNRKIVVFTMEIDKKETYEENGMLIVRCFKRNSPLSYLSLLRQIFKFNKAKDVVLEFEFASFGNTLATGFLAPLAWILFLANKDLTIVMHQVLSDIKSLSGHIGIKSKNIRMKILNIALKWFYVMLSLPAKRIVVLEEEFKTRLSKLTNPNKIIVIPHGIDTNVKFGNRNVARKSLGIKENEFAILYFGYLTWYKGVDFLIESLKDTKTIKGRPIRLIIAGGDSFTQAEKTHYKNFIAKTTKLLNNSKNVIKTGFVNEKDITPIFEAADIAVLPYRTFMSSSGPLSLAISHKKPFILSGNLSGLINSKDIEKALESSGLKKEDIVFALNKKSLIKTIANSMDHLAAKKMLLFSKTLNKERSFEKIAQSYNRLFLETNSKQILNAIYTFFTAQN